MSDCYVTCWTRVPLSGTELIITARDSDEDNFDFEDKGVWDADTGKLEGNYNQVIGASTAQTARRANTEAWRGFFRNKKKFDHDSNTSVTEHPEPPSFRGNQDDGRILKVVVEKTRTVLNGAIALGLKWSSAKNFETNMTVRKAVSESKSVASQAVLTPQTTVSWNCGMTRLIAPSELRSL
jgi:hypothetical protein